MLPQEKLVSDGQERRYRRYDGLVQLAAQISGRSISSVYAVLHGRMKSAPVEDGIKKAKRRLRARERRAAKKRQAASC